MGLKVQPRRMAQSFLLRRPFAPSYSARHNSPDFFFFMRL